MVYGLSSVACYLEVWREHVGAVSLVFGWGFLMPLRDGWLALWPRLATVCNNGKPGLYHTDIQACNS